MSDDEFNIESLYSDEYLQKMGRPRKYDRKKLAEALMEWALKEDSINMLGFTKLTGIEADVILQIKNKDKDFARSYSAVKNIIGHRREEALAKGDLHLQAYKCNANAYDQYMVESRREEAKFDSELRKNENESYSEEDMKRHEQLMDQLKNLKK